MKRINKIVPKVKGEIKPRTQLEKLERFQKINPVGIQGLIKAFDLDVNL
jgi:hypothetical protein